MRFKVENKEVIMLKDCKDCSHYKVCKFVEAQRAVNKSNLMYQMTEYLEWNNCQKSFEENSSCQFYDPSEKNKLFPTGDVTIDSYPDLLKEIVHIELKPKVESLGTKLDIINDSASCFVAFAKDGEPAKYELFKISELLTGYKIL